MYVTVLRMYVSVSLYAHIIVTGVYASVCVRMYVSMYGGIHYCIHVSVHLCMSTHMRVVLHVCTQVPDCIVYVYMHVTVRENVCMQNECYV